MSEKIKEWEELVKKAKENRAREQGRLESLMARLKQDYEHDTVEDLDAEILQVTADLRAKEADLKKLMEEFENGYLERLRRAAE